MAEENEKTMIAETVTRLFHALDEREWDTIAALTTDPVNVDYPSKQGGPEQISTKDFVTGLQAFLPGFDATHHLLGPVVVDLDAPGAATARFHARVTHLMTRATDPIWVIGCHYTFGLRRQDDVWRVSSSRVHVLYEEGNHDLENAARHRVAS